AERVGKFSFGEEWGNIQDRIDNAEDSDLKTIIKDLVAGCSSQEQAKSIINYAHSLMNARGYNIAEAKKIAENSLSDNDGEPEGTSNITINGEPEAPAQQQTGDNSSDEGFIPIEPALIAEANGNMRYGEPEGLSPEQTGMEASAYSEAEGTVTLKDNIDRFREAEGGMHDAFGESVGDAFSEMEERGEDFLNAPYLNDFQREAVREYIDSRNGLTDSERTRVGEEERIRRDVGARTHQDNGMVMPAKIKGRDGDFFVVSGNVVLGHDGKVDADKSSDNIVVYDASTGEYNMFAPDRLSELGDMEAPESIVSREMEAFEGAHPELFGEEAGEVPGNTDVAVHSAENEIGSEIATDVAEERRSRITNFEDYDAGLSDAMGLWRDESDEQIRKCINVMREAEKKGTISDYGIGALEKLEEMANERGLVIEPETQETSSATASAQSGTHAEREEGDQTEMVLQERSMPNYKPVGIG
ncbi:MAG: hypothetical protein K2L89_00520, partial [Muribaculaceae bacterium]|nr:hypothetical protein [Muribaculaceae bacterium]